MQQYREGQRLQGSDGNVYVVQGGVPRLASQGIQTKPADRKLPGELQGQGFNNRSAAVGAAVDEATKGAQIRKTNAEAANASDEIRQRRQKEESELRSQFDGLNEVKDYKSAAGALGGMLRAPDNGQGDTQVLYAFIRSQGPGPVAEGELNLAQAAASLSQRMEALYGKATEGRLLHPKARLGLIETARQGLAAKKGIYDQAYTQYRGLAQQRGFLPENITGPHVGDAIRPLEEKYIRAHGGAPKSAFRANELEFREGEDGIPELILHQESHPDNPLQKRINETDAFGSGLAGMADTATFGLADEASAGLNAIGGALSGDGSFSSLYRSNLADERAYLRALQNRDPLPYFTGNVAGSLIGMKGVSSALQGSGRLAPLATRGGGIGGDMLYGAGYGAGSSDDNRLGGAALGAGAAGAGNLVGQKVLAPAIRGVGGRLGYGTPALPAGESMIASQAIKADPGVVMSKLNEAAELGMPFTPADAATQLRSLGGNAVRKSPDAFALANENIGNRTLGQVDRLTGIVEGEMGPRLNLPTFQAGVKKAAQAKSRPLYESAKGQGPVDDAQINELLQTPAGQRAARSGYDEALNNGEPVGDLSEEVDSITGQVRLVGRPSWNVLQRMKFALDEMPDQESLARRFNSRLGTLNPDFRKANLTYAKEMRRGDIAEAGYGAANPNIRPPELSASMGAPKNMKDPALFKQGYGSNLVDKARGMRDSANPYEVASMASPDQLAKMQTISPSLFGKFGQARGIEKEMALTNKELFGGSPTAARQEADKLFDAGGLAADALELGLQVGVGAPPISAMRSQLFGGRFGMNALQDAYKMGIGKSGKQKADQIAPFLFNPNPNETAAQLAEMIRQQALRNAYVQKTGMFGSAVGAPVAISLTGR